jgi:hypothetical protein
MEQAKIGLCDPCCLVVSEGPGGISVAVVQHCAAG